MLESPWMALQKVLLARILWVTSSVLQDEDFQQILLAQHVITSEVELSTLAGVEGMEVFLGWSISALEAVVLFISTMPVFHRVLCNYYWSVLPQPLQ